MPPSSRAPDRAFWTYNSGSTDTVTVQKVDDSGSTSTLTTLNQDYTTGDKIGLEAIGTTLTVYRYTAGSWAAVGNTTDSTFTTAGYIGLTTQNQTIRLDDFGGGTVIAGGVPTGDTVTLTGAHTISNVETATNTTWTGSPTSYDYLWQTAAAGDSSFTTPTTVRNNAGSGSATDAYTPVAGDDTRLLRCKVVANNGTGASSAVNSSSVTVTYPIPTNSAAPVASGYANVGSIGSCNTGIWNPA